MFRMGFPLVAVALVVVGCQSKDEEAPSGAAHTMVMPSGEAELCPMYVKNAKVSYEDTDDGAAMRFSAPIQAKDDLLQRVRAMAAYYESAGMTDAPPFKVSVEPTGDGGRLRFHARAVDDAGALRKRVRAHASRLDEGTCAMEGTP
jgi:hypothetical protein